MILELHMELCASEALVKLNNLCTILHVGKKNWEYFYCLQISPIGEKFLVKK